MTYQPPFTITTEIIDLISAVSEQVGFVQQDFLDASPQLRKANRIKTITGTLLVPTVLGGNAYGMSNE